MAASLNYTVKSNAYGVENDQLMRASTKATRPQSAVKSSKKGQSQASRIAQQRLNSAMKTPNKNNQLTEEMEATLIYEKAYSRA